MPSQSMSKSLPNIICSEQEKTIKFLIMKKPYFKYDQKEIEYLKGKDKKLAEVIDKIGIIKREIIPDLFSALINSIVGQQISTKAHRTIYKRIKTGLGDVTPGTISACSTDELQGFGLTFRKVGYMQTAAHKVLNGEFDIAALYKMTDKEICVELSKLNGVGLWTAEMIMIFSMQRPNILSYGDLAILRGLRIIYHHRKISKLRFQKYWKRYSPYASIASLYLWAVAGGAIPEMKDNESKN
ncbi:MAG: DNA-3-methyladenine glycosylase 2 family protein [Desulfobacteraceae bacterium]|nr:DNA-3-methyladenine glycosylase 2 family protein [Desulfobacteraceae bacterium]